MNIIKLAGQVGESTGRRICVTGYNGRVLTAFREALRPEDQIDMQAIPRDALHDEAKMTDFLKRTQPKAILHAATLDEGPWKQMYGLNVEAVVRLAKIARELGLPVLNLSSTASMIPEICKDETPYAMTKNLATRELRKLQSSQDNTVCTLHSDVLVGGKGGPFSITSLACKGLPVIMRPIQRQIIQPIHYGDFVIALKHLVLDILDGHPIPKELIFSGEPIALEDFLSLMKSDSLFFQTFGKEILLSPEEMKTAAGRFRDGSFRPEFLRLADLAVKHGIVQPTDDLEHYLHILPSPEVVAKKAASDSESFGPIRRFAGILGKHPSPVELIKSGWNLMTTSSVVSQKTPPSP